MTEKEIKKKLVELAEMHGKRRAAEILKISRPYLIDILLGNRSITCPPILKYFGLEKVLTIRAKEKK